MKPLNKNKSRSIEITIISIVIPLLMVLSFQAGMLVRESIQLISEPVSEISIEINRQADTHGGLTFEEIEATITAYTSGPEETDSESCISASGLNLCEFYYEPYIAIACPLRYPFKTIVEIQGTKYICLDRLSSKYPDRFDIYFGMDKQGALEWGMRKLKIKIYE